MQIEKVRKGGNGGFVFVLPAEAKPKRKNWNELCSIGKYAN